MVTPLEWEPLGMTVEETATVLRVDRKAVLNAIRKDGLPARKIGKGYRISHAALQAWLASGNAGTEAEADADAAATEE